MCFDRALLPANATRGKNSSGPRPVSRILFAEAIARPLLLSYYFIRLLFVRFAQLRAQLENRRTIFVIFQFNSRSLKFDRRSSGSNDSFVANEISREISKRTLKNQSAVSVPVSIRERNIPRNGGKNIFSWDGKMYIAGMEGRVQTVASIQNFKE